MTLHADAAESCSKTPSHGWMAVRRVECSLAHAGTAALVHARVCAHVRPRGWLQLDKAHGKYELRTEGSSKLWQAGTFPHASMHADTGM